MTSSNLFKGIHYKSKRPIEITVENEKILAIKEMKNPDADTLPIIAPGLVDLQINGYEGRDFNAYPLSKQLIKDASFALFKEGVTSYYPTIITNGDQEIKESAETIAQACDEDDLVAKTVAGIHLEGPFISSEDGPRGAHGKEYVKAPDWSLFKEWQAAAKGKIKLLTLSPEWSNAAEFIQQCKNSGVKVSIGHTAATSQQIRSAVESGAVMSTHLGNGAHLMLPRHPNYIWEQLAQDELWNSCIADGFHLPESVLKVIFKVKKERAILVSDAVFLSGLEPGTYKTHIGGEVVLTEAGKLHLAENPDLLAGSVQMLQDGIRNLVDFGICTFAEAWDAASIHPARLMNLSVRNGLEEGAPADFVLLQNEQISQTIKAGYTVF
ncbi:N-acetylglucosamine-6-phosphate deacetylase [Gracilibacillus salinarum]|uniref:Amidohydrolase family protein n=1 Tax=Gracilibacillus salinarum TaxID=2932255 RepID=A0ABY4GNJ8_9BACI|nr:amidohydrolase family protein [Gracilibacillus salinarum]UOQ85814.1 amidohydrolase family protein [Gracilibacillus salinarum]